MASVTKYYVNRCPVDTRRKLNVHKMFRRRPGRLFNVLCTFNLRPVPIGCLRKNFLISKSEGGVKNM